MMPMVEEMEHVAAELGKSLRRESLMRAHLEAVEEFHSSPEAVELEERLYASYDDLIARQQAGEQLSREDIQAFYDLRRWVQAHPVISKRDNALGSVKPHLAEVADEISLLLSADYTALARPE